MTLRAPSEQLQARIRAAAPSEQLPDISRRNAANGRATRQPIVGIKRSNRLVNISKSSGETTVIVW